MSRLQFGQSDRGLMIELPSGRRRITTFKKLPMTTPKTTAIAKAISAVYGTPFGKHSGRPCRRLPARATRQETLPEAKRLEKYERRCHQESADISSPSA